MAEQTPASSQENVPTEDSPLPAPDLTSSPSLPAHGSASNSKLRKPPTITPRSFTRFFTPKSSAGSTGRIGASRQVLRDITASVSNQGKGKRSAQDASYPHEKELVASIRTIKRRRRVESSTDRSPEPSSPLKRICNQSLDVSEDEKADAEGTSNESDTGHRGKRHKRKLVPNSIPSSRCTRNPVSHLHHELYGEAWKSGAFAKRINQSYSVSWRYETTRFSTVPEDTFVSFNLAAPSDHTLPFCTASCKSK